MPSPLGKGDREAVDEGGEGLLLQRLSAQKQYVFGYFHCAENFNKYAAVTALIRPRYARPPSPKGKALVPFYI